MMVHRIQTLVLATIFALLSHMSMAAAQNNGINLEFNRSPASAINMLEQRGFTEVKVINRRLLALDIEACREGVRYSFKLRLDGQIYDDRRISSCTKQLTEIEVRKIAEDTGFQQINVTEVANGFRVTGCRPGNNRREQFTINRAGKVLENRVLGVCRERLTFDRIEDELKQRGFDRIRLISDQDDAYVIRACQDGRKIQFKVGLDGRVLDSGITGECPNQIDVADIVPIIKNEGFDRIVVKDKELPRYLVEACREQRRYEITMNRYGEFAEPLVIGKCRPVMSNDLLTERLVLEGLYNVKIENGRRARFLATACYAQRKFEIDYSAFGDLLGEREIGNCRRMTASEMRETAKVRGATQIETQLKACHEGSQVLYVLDREGVFVARKQSGSRC